MKIAVEMTQYLRYKLRMFEVPIDRPANMYYLNEAVYKNGIIPNSVLSKKHHSCSYHMLREAVASIMVKMAKKSMLKNLANLFTKILPRVVREILLD